MEATFVRALQYVKRMTAVDDRKIYEEFREILRQFSRRNVDSSVVVSAVKTLLHRKYPDLLEGFKAFVPSHRSAEMAAAVVEEESVEEDPDSLKRSSVDFVNRVRARLGGGAFRKFLKSMHGFARAEISATGVVDEVVGLLGGNDDLVEKFKSFLPGSCAGEGSRKRNRADRVDDECSEQRRTKRRGSDPGSRDGEETAPRRTARRLTGEEKAAKRVADRDNAMEDSLCEIEVRLSNPDPGSRDGEETAPRRTARRLTGEEKAAKRVADRDNAMEDSLCEIDVRLSNLKASIESAGRLRDRLADGHLSPAAVRLDEHFTPLNLACIRSFHAKFLEDADVALAPALDELLEILLKQKGASERKRVKIAQRWKSIRVSHF